MCPREAGAQLALLVRDGRVLLTPARPAIGGDVVCRHVGDLRIARAVFSVRAPLGGTHGCLVHRAGKHQVRRQIVFRDGLRPMVKDLGREVVCPAQFLHGQVWGVAVLYGHGMSTR